MISSKKLVSCAAVIVAMAATAVTVAAQVSETSQEIGFVAAVSGSKITLSNVPLGGGPGAGPGGGQWQSSGPGQGGAGGQRTVVMRRGPDGQAQEVKLTPEEEAKMREEMKAGGGERKIMVREGGQTRVLTKEEAEKMEAQMKAEGKEVRIVTSEAGPGGAQGQAGPGGGAQGQVVQRTSAPMKLSDFEVNAKTAKRGEITVGAKVTVHYREIDGRKVATRIDVAK